jgi:protein-export membrane protein SecD
VNKHVGVIAAVVLCIAILGAVALYGADLAVFELPSLEDGVVLGLDLQGGSSITYEAIERNEHGVETPIFPDSRDMDTVRGILRQRLDSRGFTEANLYLSSAVGNRITVEVPGVNVSEVADFLGQTAQLTFRNADDEVVLDGSMVRDARATTRQDEMGRTQWVVELDFSPEARDAFRQATEAAFNAADGRNFISINLDEMQISAPTVQSVIDDSSCIITLGAGGNPREQAQELADLIRAGSLPFSLGVAAKSNISAPLGERALNTSLLAGAIGLALVMLFMIGYYRVPGVMASVALLLYIGIFALLLSILRVNLTLPGIAGIILTMGMATDANILIFERMKDEMRTGKTIRASVDAGYRRAMAAIIDASLTTLIAAGVLFFFGTGPIRGFAITLFVGVCISMITSLLITKALLNSLVGLKVTNLKAYGV